MTAKTTDRELLELAAKAAGIELISWTNMYDACDEIGGRFITRPRGEPWNPLEDDGDALRLAVALRLKIIPGKHPGDGCTVEAQRSGIAGCTSFQDDKHEQMRYAIVRVAAEIGKAIP